MVGGGAAGGFVLRAFDSMLKECANKKYATLQSAIQNYLDSGKNFNQQSTIGETNQVLSTTSNQRVNYLVRDPLAAEEVEPTSSNGNAATALENAGQTLGEAEAELVLKPLMLAFETKNVKVVELALDCLHKLIEYNHLEGDPGLDGGSNNQLFTDILNMVCRCVDNSSQDSTTLHVLKVFLTAVASTKMRVHGEVLLEIFKACCNIALNSKSPINQAMSKAMLTQMLSIIFRRMEIDVACSNSLEPIEACLEDGPNTIVEVASSIDHNEPRMKMGGLLFVKHSTDTSLASVKEMQNLVGCTGIKDLEAVLEKALDLEDGENVTRGSDLESLSIGQHDALLLFRALCKMGIKDHSDEVATKTCMLSLELLQGLLEGVSHLCAKNSQFIDLIKAHLSYALLRGSASQSPVMFQHAAGIFSVLLLRFRENFKVEIGVLFPKIVLRSLDGSDLNHKLSVLQMLEKVCKDPQLLVDLCVNYDCDVEAPNLFERMVTTLSKIAQGVQNVDPKSVTTTQTGLMKTTALQGLVNMLKSLVDWENSHRESEKQNKGKESFQEDAVTIECDESKIKEDSPINFENLKACKSTIEAVISEFNRQPGKGIEHLISSRLVENDPASVAQFLQSSPNLDKAMLGDYLGQREKFPLAIMHAYMDSMNFSGMKFDIAIRELFKRLQLPGEAQKIDRIMETFAEHYCADNPGILKNAYTAYVLAYAVIMLNTSVHNPKVWPKMSKSDFIHMNAMNNAEESMPHELFEEIYDSIAKEEIKMKGDPSGILDGQQMLEAEKKGDLINILNLTVPKSSSLTVSQSNNEEIIKQLQAVIRNHVVKKEVFYTSCRIELVNPMVEAVGWPLLATFAVTMGEGDDKSRIGLCMEGFEEAIHISHVLRMDTMRYAFLTSLIRYNYLHAPRDMRGKNVEALRTLLGLCDSKIYALQDSWLAILECISRLEYAVSSPAMTATVMQGLNQISRDAILQSLRELAGKPVEKVFVNSIKLPSESFVEFFTALCSVSAEELKQIPARVFSLQKLVEISYYNMARIRMVWARIWYILTQHFIFAGSHSDERVATYAIDSLQQLGMKYLDHAELANFAFQNDVLKPFVSLMRSTASESIRRLIVDCVVQMIKSNVANMKSGWQSVFMIFTAAADDNLEPVVECAFENVEQVILEHFDQVIGECFMDCVNCLIGFSKNKSSPGISLKAIALLRICGDRLAEGLIPGAAFKSIDSGVAEACDATELYWFPMLAGLSDLTIDPRPAVRNCAIEVLFDILNERGSKFSSSFWERIFRQVLFPIFDNVRHAEKESLIPSGDEWLRESSVHSLLLLCNLFNTFYKDVCFMLPPLLNLLLDCAKKTDQSVVSVSLGALVHLVDVGGHQFSNQDWDTLLKSIRDALLTTQPLELLDDLGNKNSNHHKLLAKNSSSSSAVTPIPVNGGIDLPNNGLYSVSENGITARIDSSGTYIDEFGQDHSQEMTPLAGMEGSEVLSSPSGRTAKHSDGGGFTRSQTMGQRIMGNMMDNLFMRNFTSKSTNHASNDLVPSSPSKFPDTTMEPDTRDEESPVLGTIRSKCITQLLLLGAIDSFQKKYWSKLNQENKITIMEILFCVLEFAASYNSYTNLSLQMHQIPSERPPMNLLRQELAGTCIYLDILLKTTALVGTQKLDQVEEEKLEGIAEEKLVSFCEKVLKEASDLQSSMVETTNMEIHRVLELRTPIFVKVLRGMCHMNTQIFSNHLTDFYPLITKLICCDQVEIRRVLGDLISNQLKTLLS